MRSTKLINSPYRKLEEEIAQREEEMIKAYLAIYEERPLAAKDLLQEFSDGMLEKVLEVTDDLTEHLFTLMAKHTMETYEFHGA